MFYEIISFEKENSEDYDVENIIHTSMPLIKINVGRIFHTSLPHLKQNRYINRKIPVEPIYFLAGTVTALYFNVSLMLFTLILKSTMLTCFFK